MKKIDFNCDMGENTGNDKDIIKYITSANIACGYHVGDNETIKRTINLALAQNVKIGAHPSYDDKPNFGRIELNYENSKIVDLVLTQLYNFNSIANKEGAKMSYVKLHGALYNRAAFDENLAKDILINVIKQFKDLSFLVLSMSKMYDIAKSMNIKIYNEVFADRAYTDDCKLVSRKIENAVISNIEKVKKRTILMVEKNKVYSINNKLMDIKCDSICVHGDSKNSVQFAKIINESLKKEGVIIESTI